MEGKLATVASPFTIQLVTTIEGILVNTKNVIVFLLEKIVVNVPDYTLFTDSSVLKGKKDVNLSMDDTIPVKKVYIIDLILVR